MYLTLICKGEDLKKAEIFLRSFKSFVTEKNIIQVQRIITDWNSMTVYETFETLEEGDGVPIHKDEEYVNLGVRRVYGPYGTKASVKTAVSKIKAKLREKNK